MMRVYRVRLPDGRYLQRTIKGEPEWTEGKDAARWWRRRGGAENTADWLLRLGKLPTEGVPARHRNKPGAYVDWQDEDEPANSPGDD